MTGRLTSAPRLIAQREEARRIERVARELLEKHGLCKCSICDKIATERGCFNPKCPNHRRYQGKETADISQQFSLDGNRGRVSTAPVVKAVRVVKANRIEG